MSEEKKELKEEDISKVSGGTNEKEICPNCKNEYYLRDLEFINGWECCPYCKEPLYSFKP